MAKVLRSLTLLLVLLAADVVGESYNYRVKFGPVHAGSARITHVVEGDLLSSELIMTSLPWLSNLWTLSDTIVSSFDIESERLIKQYKAIHEGSYHRSYRVHFGDSTVSVNGTISKHIPEGVFDIPSLLYHLSRSSFTHNEILDYLLWDGRSFGRLTVHVEKIGKPTLLKPFQVRGWKLTPLSSTKKSREHEISLTLHFSNSDPKLPLQIHIDTKYGKVVMKLEE
ncbi:MAG: DUF3108 domain-containing protein [Candidatus Marinimicrobia bacterium]|nr:DUF3108 domain-containing protein [Candidatus Neomarinimicrobiota bacterium]MCF7851280.1 DUF3108 domain-containing protein [Candidatus Neomarinimicrobiota bacterium]MCF7904892.1 DUF3108 domain-containing protein [Candidatus Neomarinimicrobiota bacterium]